MALRYLTLAAIQAFVGDSTDGSTSMLTMMGEAAELHFDQLIGSASGLIKSTKTEIHKPCDYEPGRAGYIFDLRTHNVDSAVVPTINSTGIGTLGTDWVLEGRTITLKTQAAWPVNFPFYWSVVYSSGYTSITDIPQDVKMAVLFLVKAEYVQRQSLGIESFKQDLLSVNYSKAENSMDPSEQSKFKAIVSKYKIPYVYST